MEEIKALLDRVKQSFESKSLIKLILSKKRKKDAKVEKVTAKLVMLKKGTFLSFTEHYTKKVIVTNHPLDKATEVIQAYLEDNFFNANLFTTASDFQLLVTKKGKAFLKSGSPVSSKKPSLTHDNKKKRYIDVAHNVYLRELGVVDINGTIKPGMSDKYKQVNKYIEVIETEIKLSAFEKGIQVADMGSGKGYLTFALFDYLSNKLNLDPKVRGFEVREDLVHLCNDIAKKCGFDNLTFEKNNIKNASLNNADILIALHACDIATDEAIYKGIEANSKLIICVPCCHQQLRGQLNPEYPYAEAMKYGIIKERQSELLTDLLRAMIMESRGYKTKVFEFIDTEHTHKNVIIIGRKKSNFDKKSKVSLDMIADIKHRFGIKYHQLEAFLEAKNL